MVAWTAQASIERMIAIAGASASVRMPPRFRAPARRTGTWRTSLPLPGGGHRKTDPCPCLALEDRNALPRRGVAPDDRFGERLLDHGLGRWFRHLAPPSSSRSIGSCPETRVDRPRYREGRPSRNALRSKCALADGRSPRTTSRSIAVLRLGSRQSFPASPAQPSSASIRRRCAAAWRSRSGRNTPCSATARCPSRPSR